MRLPENFDRERDSVQLKEPTSPPQQEGLRTRSGRIVKPATRYDEEFSGAEKHFVGAITPQVLLIPKDDEAVIFVRDPMPRSLGAKTELYFPIPPRGWLNAMNS